MKVNAVTGGKKDADLDPVFEYFRVDMLPTDEGYVGDVGPGPHGRRLHVSRCTAERYRSDFLNMKKLPPRAENLRRALAQEAARIMSEHGIRDFLTAKRKAAERFGVTDGSVLPKNTEIEDALAEYQRLFGGTRHGETLAAQRSAALSAMQMLVGLRTAPGRFGARRNGHRAQRHPAASVRRARGVDHLPAHGSRHRARSGRAARALRRRSRRRLSRACISNSTTTRWMRRCFRSTASARRR